MLGSKKTVEGLRVWFFESNKPVWRIYAGNKIPANKIPIAQNLNETDMNAAWKKLRQELASMNDEGTFFVTVNNNKSANDTSLLATIIELDRRFQPQMQGIGSIHHQPQYNHYTPPSLQDQMSALSQMANIMGLGTPKENAQNFTKYSKEVRDFIDDEVERRVRQEKKSIKQDYEIQKLKDDHFSRRSNLDRFIDGIAANPQGAIGAIKDLFSPRPQAQLGVLSGGGGVDAKMEEKQTTGHRENHQGNVTPIDFNKTNHAIIALHQMGFSEIDDILLMIAQIAQHNPQSVKQQMAMLKMACENQLSQIQNNAE